MPTFKGNLKFCSKNSPAGKANCRSPTDLSVTGDPGLPWGCFRKHRSRGNPKDRAFLGTLSLGCFPVNRVQLTAGAIEQSRRQPAGGEINTQIPARIRAFPGLSVRVRVGQGRSHLQQKTAPTLGAAAPTHSTRFSSQQVLLYCLSKLGFFFIFWTTRAQFVRFGSFWRGRISQSSIALGETSQNLV